MQPTYNPWIGYFAMIDRVDMFVYLDSVAFNNRSWQQRNYIKCNGEKLFLTIPVTNKGLRGQTINKVRISENEIFPDKHIRAIEMNYQKAPFFNDYVDGLFSILSSAEGSLCDLNINLIDWLCVQFEIVTPKRRSSLMQAKGTKADLLAEICSEIGANQYLSAPGSKDYLEESDAFERRDIEILYHQYDHPEYLQIGDSFISYLGAIDLLFNVGGSASHKIIRCETN